MYTNKPSSPIVRKWVLFLALSAVLMVLILFSYDTLFRLLGFQLAFGHHSQFIDLSIRYPKDGKTGIELVSIDEGKATVRKRGRSFELEENKIPPSGIGISEVIYISEEKGEIVLERRYSKQIYRRFDYPWCKQQATMSMQEILESAPGWMMLSLSTNLMYSPTGLVDTNFGIELISIDTNGATIRLTQSGDEMYSRNGGFFEIGNSIEGVGRLQLLNSWKEEYSVLLRFLSEKYCKAKGFE